MENNIYNNEKNKQYLLLSIILGGFLNQSSVAFGVNFSFADLILLVFLLSLIVNRALNIPIMPSFFFLIVATTTLVTSFFIVPLIFNYYANPTSILTALAKLIALFLYLILGYNLVNRGDLYLVLKSFSYFAFLASIISVILIFFPLEALRSLVFYSGIRFKGFMNDPNYFSILQIIAIAFFMRLKDIKSVSKVFIISLLIFSIVMSGSKTGIISLILFLSFSISQRIFKNRFSALELIKMTALILIIGTTLIFFDSMIINAIPFFEDSIPSFRRISIVFKDLNSALSTGGSGRDNTWFMAIELIRQSPIFGVGIGTYTGITRLLYNYRSIAHNTYLQLAVEWGMPLALIFFSLVVGVVVKITFSFKEDNSVKLLRDIILILLISSMAISLHNARLFWLVLGGAISESSFHTKR